MRSFILPAGPLSCASAAPLPPAAPSEGKALAVAAAEGGPPCAWEWGERIPLCCPP